MKKIPTFIAFVLLVAGVFAQAPLKFNYQAVIRDSAGNIMANQNVSMQFSIRDLTPGGTVVYQETHAVNTGSYGVVNLEVGGGSVVSGSMATVAWGTGDKYLEVGLDPAGGSSYDILGVPQLLSVPYAIYAGAAAGLPAGTLAQTITHDGTNWVATSMLEVKPTGVNINNPGTTSKATLTLLNTHDAILSNPSDSSMGIHIRRPFADNQTGAAIGFSVSTIPTIIGGKIVFIRTGSDSQGDLGFFTRDQIGGGDPTKERMRITSTGKLGIGDSIPYRWLSIKNSDSVLLSLKSSNSISAGIEFVRVGSGRDWKFFSATTGYFTLAYGFEDFGENGDFSKVNVVQAYSSFFRPAEDNTLALGGSAYRWTTVYAANGTINTSDAREKSNIKELNYGISEVMKLRPVSFTWKDRPQEGTKLGFIAQEVEPVLGEVVKKEYFTETNDEGTTPSDQYRYGIYYSDIIPVLTRAIQEQQQMILDLQKKVKELEEQLKK